ncbi:endonuclease 2 isoform X1 [Vigna radiata var. radiata]|uniref:Aspergillus nuclease S1 n=1 Tax=Vigna radiata var. radiata TaxID=3916 RepID=A0A1S3V6J0_VIGRR|nr:endonuclease 2 isoform X1 [Vigna radiata var. radiata]
MKCYKIQLLVTLSFILLLPNTKGWGEDGHAIVCRIAQSRLSDSAADAVKNLLPKYAQNDLGSVCSWADRVRFYLHWSSALHFADTPDKLCNYQYDRDCKDQDGEKGRCVVGAIKNYTDQLLDYGKDTQYNLTQALLFLSHFMGDVHQPLHVGFTSDKGGNLINIHWYRRKQNLHHVWDVNIIETAEERFYDSDINGFTKAIQENITKTWSDQVRGWETCNSKETTCPDIYASEGIEAACKWAYKDAPEGSVLEDDYFLSRLPEVSLRLAQGGVRLAATLNRIFG